MEKPTKPKQPSSPHEKVMAVVTVIIGLIALVVIFQTVPLRFAVLPAALVVLMLIAKFLRARKKIRQAADSLTSQRRQRQTDQEDD